jgi:hypothetical protein
MRDHRKIWYWMCGLGTFELALWLIGSICARVLGTQYGAIIERIGKGKIADPITFLERRIDDSLWLIAVSIILLVSYFLLRTFLEKRETNNRYGWIALSLAVFVGANLWLASAMRTALFWSAMYTGKANSNLTQFEFKKLLLKENKAPRQAILVGSSQTQAQLDENLLNQRLGKQIWTTELHFPGSAALDLFLVTRRLKGFPGNDLVCYVSENYFYGPISPESAPYFLSWRDVGQLKGLGFSGYLGRREFAYGFLGQALPLFWCREPLTYRFLGIAIAGVAQGRYNEELETNLVKRAEATAPKLQLGAEAELQKRAFQAFIHEAARQNRRVILLEGQYNPILDQRLKPAIRADMKSFLRKIAHENSNVVLVPEEELPRQVATDYKDLTHVNAEAEERFTTWFADWLTRTAPKLAAARE